MAMGAVRYDRNAAGLAGRLPKFDRRHADAGTISSFFSGAG
jgi:hypothetical protein